MVSPDLRLRPRPLAPPPGPRCTPSYLLISVELITPRGGMCRTLEHKKSLWFGDTDVADKRIDRWHRQWNLNPDNVNPTRSKTMFKTLQDPQLVHNWCPASKSKTTRWMIGWLLNSRLIITGAIKQHFSELRTLTGSFFPVCWLVIKLTWNRRLTIQLGSDGTNWDQLGPLVIIYNDDVDEITWWNGLKWCGCQVVPSSTPWWWIDYRIVIDC